MPRLARIDAPGVAQHVIQRGNNRQICFGGEEDFAAYANWLREYAVKYNVEIHAWVFMTNHVHLLMTPHEQHGISKLMQSLGRKYVQYYNYKYKRSGTLWEGRFRSCLVESEKYVLACYRYIELNPVRAGMVENPKDYRWSSYACNGIGLASSFCLPHPSYLSLGKSNKARQACYRDLFIGQLSADIVNDIRMTTQRGLVLGSGAFKEQLGELLGRSVEHKPRGRPRKNRL